MLATLADDPLDEPGWLYDPDFSALQTWRSEADGELVYYLFDLLWYGGCDLMPLPLAQRRDILKRIAPTAGPIRISETSMSVAVNLSRSREKWAWKGSLRKRRKVYTNDQAARLGRGCALATSPFGGFRG